LTGQSIRLVLPTTIKICYCHEIARGLRQQVGCQRRNSLVDGGLDLFL